MLGAHTHEGYSTHLVCVCVKSLLTSVRVYTNENEPTVCIFARFSWFLTCTILYNSFSGDIVLVTLIW